VTSSPSTAGWISRKSLPFGTKEEVEAEVKTRIQALAPGGGYILSTSHFIQADTPPENVCHHVRSCP